MADALSAAPAPLQDTGRKSETQGVEPAALFLRHQPIGQ
jgi:hypothetical protein